MFDTKKPIAAEIIERRTQHSGSFLLVEGSSDDKFWREHVSHPNCLIRPAGGKPGVQVAIKRLDSIGFKGVLGVIDDDCDSLENRRLPSVNLVATDTRDLECLLLRTQLLEKMVFELGDHEKIATFEKQAGLSVRERLLENGLVFGRLRWLSKRMDWQLFDTSKPDDLKPEAFMDRDNWQVDKEKIVHKVASKLRMDDTGELCNLLDSLPAADPWQICQGHDLLKILRMGLQTALGDLKSAYTHEDLAAHLRLAFHDTHLAATRLYQNIRVWERANAPYQVLPAH